MLTVYSESHKLHAPRTELSGGIAVPACETPSRAERVLHQVRESGLGKVITPNPLEMDLVRKVHDQDLTAFLENAWGDWTKAELEGDAIPWVWPGRGPHRHPPRDINAKMGRFAFTSDTSITEGTWTAATTAVAVALTAQKHVADTGQTAFGLCRPPGHHAARDLYGGYCFLNNAAIAAEAFLNQGSERIAILDVDFHHGNGTQSIFYHRPEVLFLSIHGDPAHAFPYFWGHADETGAGAGEGFTINYPLPPGTGYDRWAQALETACDRIQEYSPDALVVSLGVDTYRDDPISFFGLETKDFTRVGDRMGRLKIPTVFVMEGGYAVDAIGVNTVNVLLGFENTSPG